MAGLTAKQRRFIEEYLIDRDAARAAVRAGYSEKSARAAGEKNLKVPAVKKAIEDALETEHAGKKADAGEVVEYLTAVMRGEHTEEAPLAAGGGTQEFSPKELAAKDRLKAAELLGKSYGLFADRLEIEGALPVVISGGDELED